MNITENLQRIVQAKNDIKDAIIQKGVQVDDSLTIDNFADKILQIEGGGGGEDNLEKLLKNTLTSYNIPNGITSIKPYSFYSATTLQNITIPDSVTSIGNSAFQICSSLTSITIPDSVTSIGSYAFYNCLGIKSISIGSGVTSIGTYAFYYNYAIKDLVIPDSVTSIGSSAFYNTSALSSLTLGNNVEIIDSNAFYNTKITTLTLPISIRNIGNNLLQNSKSIKNIYCKWIIPPSNGGILMGAATGGTLHVPNGTSVNYKSKWSGSTAPLGTTLKWTIVEDQGDYQPTNVLKATYNVNSITSATKLFGGNNKFASGATTNAYGSTIWINETPQMYSGSGYTFSDIGLKEIRIDNCPSVIPSTAFQSCPTLTSVEIPNNVKEIPYDALRGNANLTNVKLGNSVPKLSQYQFSGNTTMQIIDFGNERDTIPTLYDTTTNTLGNNSCRIVVPDALYDEWIISNKWKDIARRIIKYSDYYNES